MDDAPTDRDGVGSEGDAMVECVRLISAERFDTQWRPAGEDPLNELSSPSAEDVLTFAHSLDGRRYDQLAVELESTNGVTFIGVDGGNAGGLALLIHLGGRVLRLADERKPSHEVTQISSGGTLEDVPAQQVLDRGIVIEALRQLLSGTGIDRVGSWQT